MKPGPVAVVEVRKVRAWARRQLARKYPKEEAVPHGWKVTLANLLEWLKIEEGDTR